jgi:hypothetical protein
LPRNADRVAPARRRRPDGVLFAPVAWTWNNDTTTRTDATPTIATDRTPENQFDKQLDAERRDTKLVDAQGDNRRRAMETLRVFGVVD